MLKSFFLTILTLTNIIYAQPHFVTTIPPFQFIIKEITGERADVYCIIPPGASPHTYEMRASDMRSVEKADALFMGNENLDRWALKFKTKKRCELVDLIPAEYRLVFDNHKSHFHKVQGHSHDHDGVDPHFWSDPLAVKAILPALTAYLSELDPPGKPVYEENMTAFSGQLDSLDTQIKTLLKPVKGHTVILSHPFFRYFFNRYDLHLAGIVEIAAGTEPSPKDLVKVIKIIKDEKVKAIFTHPQLSDRPSQIIAEAAGIYCVMLDPLGGVEGKASYKELLLANTHTILEALQ